MFQNLKNVLKDILAAQKQLKKKTKKITLDIQEQDAKRYIAGIPKAIRRIQSTLKAPSSFCNLAIEEEIQHLSSLITVINRAFCIDFNSGSPKPTCNAPGLGEALSRLSNAESEITNLIKIDDNKDGISDVCE